MKESSMYPRLEKSRTVEAHFAEYRSELLKILSNPANTISRQILVEQLAYKTISKAVEETLEVALEIVRAGRTQMAHLADSSRREPNNLQSLNNANGGEASLSWVSEQLKNFSLRTLGKQLSDTKPELNDKNYFLAPEKLQ